ncbi:MAG TPA: DinB family protein [Pedobacter sp.]|uniref:DinB family protein n=1 Tax=Pedobacter sp. TaxID=1411316 RepID=UPI002C8237DE|nr:DinB family protein [Pedobacter sp.]HMI03255.1 DinB family protein [Pedobacter sp.]
MDQSEIFVKMGLHSWNTQIARAEQVFNSYTEAEFYKEVAPGKNRIIYLYGHFIAYHDALKETLGFGKRTFPELFSLFLQNADDKDAVVPSVAKLRELWKTVHSKLQEFFDELPIEEWFKKHNAMTDQDFENDPTRNKLSVLLNRANHIAYHIGQIKLVKPEERS